MMQQTIYKRRNPCFAILKYRYLRYHHFKHGCYLRDPAFKKKKKRLTLEQKKTKSIDSNICTHMPAICINGFKTLIYVGKF